MGGVRLWVRSCLFALRFTLVWILFMMGYWRSYTGSEFISDRITVTGFFFLFARCLGGTKGMSVEHAIPRIAIAGFPRNVFSGGPWYLYTLSL